MKRYYQESVEHDNYTHLKIEEHLIKKNYDEAVSEYYKDLPVLEFKKVIQLYDIFHGKYNVYLSEYQIGATTEIYKTNFLTDPRYKQSKSYEDYMVFEEYRMMKMKEFFQPAPFDFVVYRCVPELFKKNYCDKGFTSTSLVPNKQFCVKESDLMIINIKKGQLIYYFAQYNFYFNQFEILLPPCCFRNISQHNNIYTYEIDSYKKDLEQENFILRNRYRDHYRDEYLSKTTRKRTRY